MATETLAPPTVSILSGTFIVATFDGKQNSYESALAFLDRQTITINHVVSPPSKQSDMGFGLIELNPQTYELSADGILITSGQTVGMYSRDCPITFLMDTSRNEGVVMHCGRPAMTPRDHLGKANHTIIDEALAILIARGSDVANLTAVITASICKRCFVHDLINDQDLLLPFYRSYPEVLDMETGALDLVALIKLKLNKGGMNLEQIYHDGHCTKEHEGFASKRGGDKSSNLTAAHIP